MSNQFDTRLEGTSTINNNNKKCLKKGPELGRKLKDDVTLNAKGRGM